MLVNKLPRLVLFDLDGTLIDTVPYLNIAVNAALEKLGYPQVDESLTRIYVGNGPYVLLARAIKRRLDATLNDIDQVKLRVGVDEFNRVYRTQNNCRKDIYKGVLETLDYFRENNVKMAIVTNKPDMFVKDILCDSGLDGYFSYFLGSGVIEEKKPDPTPLLYVANKLNIDISDCVMVGDSLNDIIAAKNAKCCSIALTYGYNHGKDIRESNPDYVFDDFIKIKELFDNKKI